MIDRASQRRFATIIGLSMALHALLFAAVAWQRQPKVAPLTRIIASFRVASPAPSGPLAQAASSAPAAVPSKVRQSPRPAEHPSVPSPVVAAGPTNVPSAASPETAAPATQAPPAQSSVVPVGEPAPQRSQADLLGSYRQKLSDLLARRQEYPRIAALRGWEGEVRLRLRVARKGNLLAVQLDHSSGFDVLDQHALAMLEQLAALPPLPDGLDINEIQVVVPVNYKLKKII